MKGERVEQENPNIAQPPLEEAQPLSETTQPTEQTEQDNSKEHNFRVIREAKEQAERERDESARKYQQLEEQMKHQQQAAQPVEEDYGIANDELVEGKHYRKMMNEMKELKQQLSNVHQESTTAIAERKLKDKYHDFDSVVSEKNIKILRDKYPHLAQTLHSDPNLLSKGSSAYTMIKELGLDKSDLYDRDRALADQNHNKPRPLTSISPQQGDSPLSHANAFANGLTPELQKKLWREMSEAKKNM